MRQVHFPLPNQFFGRSSIPALPSEELFYEVAALAIKSSSLSPFGRDKAALHEISRMLGFAGKASGIEGGQVEQLVAEGRIGEVAAYCPEDVVNTYRIWLLYELFCGRLSRGEYEASEETMWRRI